MRTYDYCQKCWTILQFVIFPEKNVRSAGLYYSKEVLQDCGGCTFSKNISETNINSNKYSPVFRDCNHFLLEDVYGQNADEVGDENQEQKLLSSLLFVDVDIIKGKRDFLSAASSHHLQLLLVAGLEAVSVARPRYFPVRAELYK